MSKTIPGITVLEGFANHHSRVPQSSSSDIAAGESTPAGTLQDQAQQEGIRQLGVALMAAEKRMSALLTEREQLARELHTGVLALLNTLKVRNLGNQPGTSRARMNQAWQGGILLRQAEQAVEKLRRIILQLESGIVAKFDLASELRRVVGAYQTPSPLPISLDLQRKAIELLTQEEAHELLTVAREAVSNCVRHARATRATIALKTHRARITLTIRDDGKGFRPLTRHSYGCGLATMADCAERLGWQLHVRSQLGRGTLIKAEYLMGPALAVV